MATPAGRFQQANPATVTPIRARTVIVNRPDHRTDEGYWVARRASAVGVVWVNWQQVCRGVAAAGSNIDVWVTDQVMQYSTATTYCAPRNAPTEGRSARSERRSLAADVPSRRVSSINRHRSVTHHPKLYRPTLRCVVRAGGR
jgi:hypothetical protein